MLARHRTTRRAARNSRPAAKRGPMNYANIKYCDIANGVGVRTSIFVSGCRIHCPGCFNESAWDFNAGDPYTPEVEARILDSLEPYYVDGLTVLGGEPMEPENQEGIVGLLEAIRERYGHDKSIWLYSGHTWEQLRPEGGWYLGEITDRILNTLDVLVDGPFVQAEYDITLRFKGSANQRLIDVPATLAAPNGEVILWKDDPLFTTHTM